MTVDFFFKKKKKKKKKEYSRADAAQHRPENKQPMNTIIDSARHVPVSKGLVLASSRYED